MPTKPKKGEVATIKMAKTTKIAILASIYIAMSSVTGGYYYNHRCDDIEEVLSGSCGIHSVVAGYGWPAYWIGRAGIEVTK